MANLKNNSDDGLTQFIAGKIVLWFQRASNGREIFPVPWQSDINFHDQKIPDYARDPQLPVGIIVGSSLGFFLIGWSLHAKVLAALGAALLVLVGLAWRRTWIQCGKLIIGVTPVKRKLHEGDEFSFNVAVTNSGATKSESSLIHCVFPGSIDPEQYLSVPSLARGERRNITVKYKLDRGMGEFRIESLSLVVRDPLGFFGRSIRESVDIEVDVVPEQATMEPLEVHVAGSTMHSGVFEAKISGDSPTFLGLRPFRSGDSIRRIDWRRSQRHQELVVREYERLNSTDATVVVDTRGVGLFEFGALNSMETIRDTVIAAINSLLHQQIRVKLVTEELSTDMSKGQMHFDLIVDVVRNLRARGSADFVRLFRETLELVPADSVIVPIFFLVGCDLNALVELFLTAEHNRIEVLPIMIDTESFEAAITDEANLTTEQKQALNYIKMSHISGSSSHARDGEMPDHFKLKTIVIGAGQSISSVYRRGC